MANTPKWNTPSQDGFNWDEFENESVAKKEVTTVTSLKIEPGAAEKTCNKKDENTISAKKLNCITQSLSSLINNGEYVRLDLAR